MLRTTLTAIALLFVATLAQAQTPNVHLQWPPNDDTTTSNVTSYNLYVDAAPAVSVPATTTVSCTCIQYDLFLAPGKHTWHITAVNQKLTDDASNPPGSIINAPQESDPSATITLTVNNKPHKPGTPTTAK